MTRASANLVNITRLDKLAQVAGNLPELTMVRVTRNFTEFLAVHWQMERQREHQTIDRYRFITSGVRIHDPECGGGT
jgi:hypothetical protein